MIQNIHFPVLFPLFFCHLDLPYNNNNKSTKDILSFKILETIVLDT